MGRYKQLVYLRVRNMKKCMGISKCLNIVNLHRALSMLKIKINVNLRQLLSVVVSAAQNDAQIRYFEPQKRQYITTEIGLRLF